MLDLSRIAMNLTITAAGLATRWYDPSLEYTLFSSYTQVSHIRVLPVEAQNTSLLSFLDIQGYSTLRTVGLSYFLEQ